MSAKRKRMMNISGLDEDKPAKRTLHLSVDAMRTLRIPLYNVSDQPNRDYYATGTKIFNMGIYNECSGKGQGFLWDETHLTDSVSRIQFTMDNCAVNKSYKFLGYLMSLAHKYDLEEVILDFLVTGHTKFSPDRMFGWMSSELKTRDIFNTNNILTVYNNADKGKNYSAREITEFNNFDYLDSLTRIGTKRIFNGGIQEYTSFTATRTEQITKVMALKSHLEEPIEVYQRDNDAIGEILAMDPPSVPAVPLPLTRLKELHNMQQFSEEAVQFADQYEPALRESERIVAESEFNINNFNVAQLKAELVELGLSTRGTKRELFARLVEVIGRPDHPQVPPVVIRPMDVDLDAPIVPLGTHL